MKIVAAAIAIALAANQAAAADCEGVPMPPAEFDHKPSIHTFVRYMPFGIVDHECRRRISSPIAISAGPGIGPMLDQINGGGFETKACSWKFAGLGFIIVSKPGIGGVTPEWAACALRHEIAHINGWPAWHPGQHF